ncbi:YSC84-related protein [Sedimenticola sp.]|uniref:lipid-binding SYLF domain-containing protein n=1 Tax=Sedimenticola sp. TaxID=1940285 RepID=UPI003D0D494F
MNRRRIATLMTLITLTALPFTQAANAGWDPREDSGTSKSHTGNRSVDEAITNLKKKDPGIKIFFNKAYGYAIFPTVGKAGIGLGGAYGEGEVYRQGHYLGTSSLSQITIGFQLGGQAYTEIIFFKDKRALNDFTSGNFEFNAQASAVAVTAGASADADYDNGVAIFTMPKGGLMYEATVGGQKFSFTPAR